ncbi:MAG TPA: class I SAM-dependent methyltransferase, partial [Burkholderiaceae bacterium]
MNDSDRPAVLAHQRFAADRASFQGLDLRGRFERIHATNLWGAATSVSGLGSEQPAIAALTTGLPSLLRELKVASLLDAPCGDALWINRIGLEVDYTGVDIVPAIVEALQQRAAAGELAGRYLLADITRDPLPRADAVLCRDCLVHLSFAHIERVLDNLRRSGATWLITTTFSELQAN